MKRAILPALMIMLLCACSSAEKLKEEFNDWRAGVENVSLTAVVTASQENAAAEYELRCEFSPEKTVAEILSPDTIKGITASKTADGTQLEYDGLILELGDHGGISPINAIPTLLETVRTGFPERCYREKYEEKQLLAVEFAPENDITVHLWLDENMKPVRADIVSGNFAGIKIAITDWNMG